MVDPCLLKLLGSSPIDCISTNSLGFHWEGSHFSNPGFKAWSSNSKG